MSAFLFNEAPRIFSPTLAKHFGINAALVLQQVHFWVEHNKEKKKAWSGGHYWSFHTYEQWLEQFPWMSEPTLRRTFRSLEKRGFLISFQQRSSNRTKWYRVDQTALIQAIGAVKKTEQMAEIVPIMGTKMTG